MASTQVLLLLLLLVSLASASHHFGGKLTFTYKGRNPDGTYNVEMHSKQTFERCSYYYSYVWSCYTGNCGTVNFTHAGLIDQSTNAPLHETGWCETDRVIQRTVPSDKPFQMREASCCWIPTRNSVWNWRQLAYVDLGMRSDTGKPNTSPDISILPFLRVPQNCPRTYKLLAFDPDGDKVRCRYGSLWNVECSSCILPSAFTLDEESCTLYYRYASAASSVYAMEMVVEDFPQRGITLGYADGSQSHRAPLIVRSKRQAPYYHQTTAAPTAPSWWYWHTTATPTTNPQPWWWWWQSGTTAAPTASAPTTNSWWWWWQQQHTTAAPTTTAPTTNSWWWWWQQQHTTAAPTTAAPTANPWWWWWQQQHTTAAPTTAAPTTNSWWWWWQQQHTTTTTTPTTTAPTTTSWWWWWQQQHATTTTTAPRTTTSAPTTTSWWWWWQQQHATTTTTAPATTTTAPTTTSWWWWQSTTTTPPRASTTAPTPWWWWWHPTTTATPTSTPTPTPTPTPTTTQASSTSSYLHASTPPLSKLPLHFSFLVDPAVPSCQEGLYLPKLLPPTPEYGARIHAEVNKEVEIRVKAHASYSTLHSIIMSGPMNISKHRTTHDEFVIRWTPTPDNVGNFYPICFVVEATAGSSVYQSEMRCVLVEVGKQIVKSHVICTESTMTVEVEKSSLPGLHEDHLRLNDPSNTACSLTSHSNSTHVVGVIPLNACGTQIEEDDDNLIFRNEITTFDNIRDVITRKHLFEVQFCCVYPKRGNVTQGFKVHRKNITVWEKGFGTFTYDFEFYPNNQYRTMIDPNSYPLEYELGNRIYMQIEATSSVNNTELFVESCRAAPYDNPNYRPTYSIIDNGCKVDPTVQIHSPDHDRQFRFSMEAFKFIGMHDQVYISCSVMMCEEGNPNSRCSKGCINSTQSGGRQHYIQKREAVTQSSRHQVSQGPLRLRRSAERAEGPVMNLNLNLVFIAGCLLAAVGMISAVVMYKAKMSRVRYQPLPTHEG